MQYLLLLKLSKARTQYLSNEKCNHSHNTNTIQWNETEKEKEEKLERSKRILVTDEIWLFLLYFFLPTRFFFCEKNVSLICDLCARQSHQNKWMDWRQDVNIFNRISKRPFYSIFCCEMASFVGVICVDNTNDNTKMLNKNEKWRQREYHNGRKLLLKMSSSIDDKWKVKSQMITCFSAI